MASSSVMRVAAIVIVMELSWLRSDAVFEKAWQQTESLVKRSVLTFPPDSAVQVNMGITLAGHLESNTAVVVLAFQQNFPVPRDSLPLLSPSVVVSGRRFSLYDHLTSVFSSYGFEGAECLRKMICQVGESPLMGGLLEDVLSFVLSPSRIRSLGLTGGKKKEVELLLESEKLGASGGNCTSAFPRCVRSPLDMISAVVKG